MSPTIRISEDTYEQLKQHAEPFVDTPDAVIRRLLGLTDAPGAAPGAGASDSEVAAVIGSSVEPPSGPAQRTNGAGRAVGGRARGRGRRARSGAAKETGRAPRGSLLSDDAYELPILEVLAERGGRAGKNEVLDAVEPLLTDQLTALDHESVRSGEIRWRNRAQFARLRLVQRGDMQSGSPRGIWEITDQGRQRLTTAGTGSS